MDFVKEAGQDGKRIVSALKDYIPTLSAHQQKKIDRGVRDVIITCEVNAFLLYIQNALGYKSVVKGETR